MDEWQVKNTNFLIFFHSSSISEAPPSPRPNEPRRQPPPVNRGPPAGPPRQAPTAPGRGPPPPPGRAGGPGLPAPMIPTWVKTLL